MATGAGSDPWSHKGDSVHARLASATLPMWFCVVHISIVVTCGDTKADTGETARMGSYQWGMSDLWSHYIHTGLHVGVHSNNRLLGNSVASCRLYIAL